MQDYDARGRRRLDPPAEDDWAAGSATRRRAVERRDTGVRQTRRISSWTAAALVAGVAASAGYFAHAAMPAGTTSGTSATGTASGTGTGTTGPEAERDPPGRHLRRIRRGGWHRWRSGRRVGRIRQRGALAG